MNSESITQPEFTKGRLEPTVRISSKISCLSIVLNKSVQLKHIKNGDLGLSLQPLGNFSVKIHHLNATWMTFRTIVEPFESTKLLNLKII